jgi:hypothetical protein
VLYRKEETDSERIRNGMDNIGCKDEGLEGSPSPSSMPDKIGGIMFKFSIYVETGLRGYWVTLFALTEKDALDKAKATFLGEYYRVGGAEEILED